MTNIDFDLNRHIYTQAQEGFAQFSATAGNIFGGIDVTIAAQSPVQARYSGLQIRRNTSSSPLVSYTYGNDGGSITYTPPSLPVGQWVDIPEQVVSRLTSPGSARFVTYYTALTTGNIDISSRNLTVNEIGRDDLQIQGVLRLEVEDDTLGLVNLIENPNGLQGGYGWVTPINNSVLEGIADPFTNYKQGLKYTTASNAGGNYFQSEPFPVIAGQYVGAGFRIEYTPYGYSRARIEWLNSSQVQIGQTAWATYTASYQDYTITASLAPASTAFARIKFEVGGSAGAYPYIYGGSSFGVRNVVACKAATAGALVVTRANLIPNPSFETNTTGWAGRGTLARVAGGSHGSWCAQVTATSTQVAIDSPQITTFTPGYDYTLSCYVKCLDASIPFYIVGYWSDSAGTLISFFQNAQALVSTTGFQRLGIALTAPSNATRMNFVVVNTGAQATVGHRYQFDGFQLEQGYIAQAYFDGASGTVGTTTHSWDGTAHASVSRETNTNLGTLVPLNWRNILGPTHEIHTEREELNLGVMSATILDTFLDPATADTLRPGRKVRLLAFNSETGAMDQLFTGKATKFDVEYDKLKEGLLTPVTNFIHDSSTMDSTTSPWSPYSSVSASYTTLTSISTGDGFRCVRAEKNTASNNLGASTNGMDEQPAGRTVTISAEVQNPFGSAFTNIRFIARDDTNNDSNLLSGSSVIGGAISHELPANNVWTTISVTFVVPADRNFQRLYIYKPGAVPVGERLHFRKVMVTESNHPKTFFDGDTAGAHWNGTPYASSSTKTSTGNTKSSRIYLTAVDPVQTLASARRPQGVGKVSDLPYVLEGAGVPWSINGNGNQVASATVVSTNDNATALDQIAITRDSELGYAWVDRNGVAQAWSVLPDPDVELVTNGTFAGNVTGWWATGNGATPTLAYSTTQFSSSPGSARLTAAANQTAMRIGTHNPASNFRGAILVTPGVTYDLTVKVRAGTTARNIQVYVDWWNEPGTTSTYLSTSGDDFNVGGATLDNNTGWTTYTQRVVAPTGATAAEVYAGVIVTSGTMPAGEIHYIDDVSMRAVVDVTVLDEARYSGLDVSFSSDDCINSVTVKYLRYNGTDGTTAEEVYGPYEDLTSIATWGLHSAKFTVHGFTIDAATFGNAVLARNANPSVRANSVVLPIKDETYLTRNGAFVDLYDLVNVVNVEKAIDQNLRVTRVVHDITPDKWLTEVGFSDMGSVASPQMTPPVQNGGYAADTGWIYPTMGNSWVNFDGGYQTARYRRINGIVYVQGLIKSGVIGTTAFTLNEGFRPAATIMISAVDGSNTANGRLDILSGGAVVPTTGSAGFYSIDCQFPAEL